MNTIHKSVEKEQVEAFGEGTTEMIMCIEYVWLPLLHCLICLLDKKRLNRNIALFIALSWPSALINGHKVKKLL